MSANFQLEDILGHGKYANVYKATRTSSNIADHDAEHFAIKVIKPDKTKRTRREHLILKNLQGGPNIVKYHGCWVDINVKTRIFCQILIHHLPQKLSLRLKILVSFLITWKMKTGRSSLIYLPWTMYGTIFMNSSRLFTIHIQWGLFIAISNLKTSSTHVQQNNSHC